MYAYLSIYCQKHPGLRTIIGIPEVMTIIEDWVKHSLTHTHPSFTDPDLDRLPGVLPVLWHHASQDLEGLL